MLYSKQFLRIIFNTGSKALFSYELKAHGTKSIRVAGIASYASLQTFCQSKSTSCLPCLRLKRLKNVPFLIFSRIKLDCSSLFRTSDFVASIPLGLYDSG